MHNLPSDNELIEQVLQGNTHAYATLVDRYNSFVFTIVLRYVKSREDAEEIAQDVFVKAFRSLAGFKKESKYSTWLYTIAVTTSISFLRKKKVEIHSLDNEKVFATAGEMSSEYSANQVEQKSKITMVHEAINLLNPEDAQVLLLFYKAEQSLEEIATILGKESNAVKVQLHRARTRLKEKLQQHYSAELKELRS